MSNIELNIFEGQYTAAHDAGLNEEVLDDILQKHPRLQDEVYHMPVVEWDKTRMLRAIGDPRQIEGMQAFPALASEYRRRCANRHVRRDEATDADIEGLDEARKAGSGKPTSRPPTSKSRRRQSKGEASNDEQKTSSGRSPKDANKATKRTHDESQSEDADITDPPATTTDDQSEPSRSKRSRTGTVTQSDLPRRPLPIPKRPRADPGSVASSPLSAVPSLPSPSFQGEIVPSSQLPQEEELRDMANMKIGLAESQEMMVEKQAHDGEQDSLQASGASGSGEGQMDVDVDMSTQASTVPSSGITTIPEDSEATSSQQTARPLGSADNETSGEAPDVAMDGPGKHFMFFRR